MSGYINNLYSKIDNYFHPSAETVLNDDKISYSKFLEINGSLKWGNFHLNQEEVGLVKQYMKMWTSYKSISSNVMEKLLQRIRNDPIKLDDYSLLERDAQSKNGRFWKIIGSTGGAEEERSYLFKFDESSFGPFNSDNVSTPEFHQENLRDFPAVQSGYPVYTHLCMDEINSGMEPFYEAIGFRLDTFVIDHNGNKIPGAYLVLPGPELTRTKINAFIQGQDWINIHINNISVKIVEGVASDRDFIQAHLDAVLVISPNDEFLHDQFNHTITQLSFLFKDPLKFKIALERFHEIIPPILDRILAIKENNFSELIWSDEEKAKIIKYIDPCLTLLSARIDNQGKSLFLADHYINSQMETILRSPPWIAYFQERYPGIGPLEPIQEAFTLLTRGLKTAP